VLAGEGDERAVAAEFGFASQEGFAIEVGRLEVIVDRTLGRQARKADAAGTIPLSDLIHRRLPQRLRWVLFRTKRAERPRRGLNPRNRKAQRYQIINRFKDFEKVLNRLSRQKIRKHAQRIGTGLSS
jgi:hypothetical protein